MVKFTLTRARVTLLKIVRFDQVCSAPCGRHSKGEIRMPSVYLKKKWGQKNIVELSERSFFFLYTKLN